MQLSHSKSLSSSSLASSAPQTTRDVQLHVHSYIHPLNTTEVQESVVNSSTTSTNPFSKFISWLIYIPNRHSNNSISDKNYKAFKTSNYIYFFGGRLQTSLAYPQRIYNNLKIKIIVLPILIILLLFPIIIFCIFEASWFWNNISPSIVILFCYCWLQMFINVMKAALLDPGVLPNNVHITDDVQRYGLPSEYHCWIDMPASTTMKYCDTCRIWRPVRSSHCSRCRVCISNMDHHCPWLGTCVGQRTYTFFVTFLVFAVVTTVFLLAMSVYKVTHAKNSNSNFTGVDIGAQRNPWAVLLAVYAGLCLPYPLLLLIFHLGIGLAGISTREYFNLTSYSSSSSSSSTSSGSPCSQFVFSWGHLRDQWLRRSGAPAVNVHAHHLPGDMRFAVLDVGTV